MNLRMRTVGVALGSGLLGMIPGVGQAGAQTLPPLTCGQTITVSRTLTDDLGPCPSYGLILGADNITLDLNGFTISGTPQPFDNAGVWVFQRTGTTVRNGTVTAFDAGVVIEGGGHNTVTGITAAGQRRPPGHAELQVRRGDRHRVVERQPDRGQHGSGQRSLRRDRRVLAGRLRPPPGHVRAVACAT